jgi:hypothetical protein
MWCSVPALSFDAVLENRGAGGKTHSMEDTEGRTFLRQLVDDRQLVGRVAFWLVVCALWSVLQSRRSLRLLRQQWKG